ncbi:MAG: histidine--tRNA ligase [Candidatus Thermoplasmatota archaeon]
MFQIPRGTRDIPPDEMYKRRYVESTMRRTFISFGYREIQTPTFEHLELFTAKSGEGIINEIYSFKDKSGRDLALRPELTAPVIRFYVDQMQMQPKPLKLFYFGNCFRYDRPQKGRYREFQQAGCELIGAGTPEAHAELIALAYNILKNTGLSDIRLYIGNLTILHHLFKMMGLTDEQKRYITPLIDKALYDELSSFLEEIKIDKNMIHEFLDLIQNNNIEKIQPYINKNDDTVKSLEHLKEITVLLEDSYSIKNYNLKLGIVRGLDYYQDIVFEIEAPKLGAEKQLCGGGAYNLVKLFGGTDIPTSGFAIGFDRTIIALESEGYKFPTHTLDTYIIPVGEDMIPVSLKLSTKLRETGITVDVDLLRRGLSKSLKYASSIKAKNAIIIGSEEYKNNTVIIRDLETGEQKTTKIDDINNVVKKTKQNNK